MAESSLSRVEEMIQLLDRGRLEVPEGADPGTFIISDGRRVRKSAKPQLKTLSDLFARYDAELPYNTKEESTRAGENIHIKHLTRHLKPHTNVHTTTTADLQAYISRRAQDKWRGKAIRPETIRKEITTFRLIWNWAVDHGYIKGPAPTKGLKFPKQDEKPPFMTWSEIEKIIGRGVRKDEEDLLWQCLFLDRSQIDAVVDYVGHRDQAPLAQPMFAFAAYTGARRSEILRSQIEDFDFDAGIVKIREKKRSKRKATTFRMVGLAKKLAEIMTEWFSDHPGGRFSICDARKVDTGLDGDAAHRAFEKALAGSQWDRIRGFHVFRHSFASNAALSGVPQGVIDEWLGHTTEEMRRRYRHLFPDQRSRAIESIFSPQQPMVPVTL